MSALVTRIKETLSPARRLTKRDIARELAIAPSSVNQVLYGHPALFEVVGHLGSLPVWQLVAGAAALPMPPPVSPPPHAATRAGGQQPAPPLLYPYQRDAIERWRHAERRGIVEMVTGAGKTRVALEAAGEALRDGGCVLVLVPGIELLAQWSKALAERFPSRRIGRLGDGFDDRAKVPDVLVAVINSAAQRPVVPWQGAKHSLLIADECHRYGARKWRAALQAGYVRRIGLSATYERQDGAHAEVLIPYFGPVVHTVGYAAARAGGGICRFNIAILSVDMNDTERDTYEASSRAFGKACKDLVILHGVPESPRENFFARLNAIAADAGHPGRFLACRAVSALTARRKVLAECERKFAVLPALAPALRMRRTIVFTETIKAAERVQAILLRNTLRSVLLHSGLDASVRSTALGDFACGRVPCLVAVRALDEGVDVPDADLALIFATSKSPRQFVQRVGRVLRRKQDGRAATVVLLAVKGAASGPDLAPTEGVLSDLKSASEKAIDVDASERTALAEFALWLFVQPSRTG